MIKGEVLSVRITKAEWITFHQICEKMGVTAQELLYACVKDVLWENGDVRRREQEGRQALRKAGEAS